jgi:serine/threonine-protein phosphatase 2A regulatory subunit B
MMPALPTTPDRLQRKIHNHGKCMQYKDVTQMSLQFSQSFGPGEADSKAPVWEEDVFSVVQFDNTGDFLATGDKGGRITVLRQMDCAAAQQSVQYEHFLGFQAYEKGFDALCSSDVSEAITDINWLPAAASGQLMLISNENTVRMFKLQEKPSVELTPPSVSFTWPDRDENDMLLESGSADFDAIPVTQSTIPQIMSRQPTQSNLVIPKSTINTSCEAARSASIRRQYKVDKKNAAAICSTSVCSDRSTFLTADALNILLWNVERIEPAFQILDITPEDLTNVQEVILCAKYHPDHCWQMACSTSSGDAFVYDLRSSALLDTKDSKTRGAEIKLNRPAVSPKFAVFIDAVSDVSFVPHQEHCLVTRDYLHSRVWDLRKTSEPVKVWNVQTFLEPFLKPLNKNNCLVDKFSAVVSPCGRYVASGSYGGNFVVTPLGMEFEDQKDVLPPPLYLNGTPEEQCLIQPCNMPMNVPATENRAFVKRLDFAKKALNIAWHPRIPAVAFGSLNEVHTYQQFR